MPDLADRALFVDLPTRSRLLLKPNSREPLPEPAGHPGAAVRCCLGCLARLLRGEGLTRYSPG
jgi:hypothetical protein